MTEEQTRRIITDGHLVEVYVKERHVLLEVIGPLLDVLKLDPTQAAELAAMLEDAAKEASQ